MNKFVLTILAGFISVLVVPTAYAQMMGVSSNRTTGLDEIAEHTLREEAEGKELWNKLQAEEIACADLDEEQYGVLGEYFMGQMVGDSHAAMNAMLIQMHGEDGEEKIHIAMGKRFSGCETSASFSAGNGDFLPMTNMMRGGRSSPFTNNSTNNMMNFGFGLFGGFGLVFMILWWGLVIAGIVVFIRWLTKQARETHSHEKSALDILKERYAQGEIGRKEFEEKKKDLA